jgi:hypothetical protein
VLAVGVDGEVSVGADRDPGAGSMQLGDPVLIDVGPLEHLAQVR